MVWEWLPGIPTSWGAKAGRSAVRWLYARPYLIDNHTNKKIKVHQNNVTATLVKGIILESNKQYVLKLNLVPGVSPLVYSGLVSLNECSVFCHFQ